MNSDVRFLQMLFLLIFLEAVVHRCSSKQVFLKTCNFIKKRLHHRYFPVNFAKRLGTLFFHRTSPVAGFVFSETKVKMEKYIHTNIFHKKNTSDGVLFSMVAVLRAHNFTKKRLLIRCFCEICEVLQNLIFTEDSWATGSDFQ